MGDKKLAAQYLVADADEPRLDASSRKTISDAIASMWHIELDHHDFEIMEDALSAAIGSFKTFQETRVEELHQVYELIGRAGRLLIEALFPDLPNDETLDAEVARQRAVHYRAAEHVRTNMQLRRERRHKESHADGAKSAIVKRLLSRAEALKYLDDFEAFGRFLHAVPRFAELTDQSMFDVDEAGAQHHLIAKRGRGHIDELLRILAAIAHRHDVAIYTRDDLNGEEESFVVDLAERLNSFLPVSALLKPEPPTTVRSILWSRVTRLALGKRRRRKHRASGPAANPWHERADQFRDSPSATDAGDAGDVTLLQEETNEQNRRVSEERKKRGLDYFDFDAVNSDGTKGRWIKPSEQSTDDPLRAPRKIT